jgi:hypothetical protein
MLIFRRTFPREVRSVPVWRINFDGFFSGATIEIAPAIALNCVANAPHRNQEMANDFSLVRRE